MDGDAISNGRTRMSGALPVCACALALTRAEERVCEMLESRAHGEDLLAEARFALAETSDVPGREEFEHELMARADELDACRRALAASASSASPQLARGLAWLVALGDCAQAPRDEEDDALSPILRAVERIDPDDPGYSISRALLEAPSWRESLARGCETVFGSPIPRSCRLVLRRPAPKNDAKKPGDRKPQRRGARLAAAIAAAGVTVAGGAAALLAVARRR